MSRLLYQAELRRHKSIPNLPITHLRGSFKYQAAVYLYLCGAVLEAAGFEESRLFYQAQATPSYVDKPLNTNHNKYFYSK